LAPRAQVGAVIVDLHSHLPMHLIPRRNADTYRAIRSPWRGARGRAVFVNVLSRWFNYQGPGHQPGVTIRGMRDGRVGVALSVLFLPLDEIDLDERYGAPPRDHYFESLRNQLCLVEREVNHGEGKGQAVIARNPASVKDAVDEGNIAVVHCVEGGHALGATETAIRQNVGVLAQRGVAYITVAHLFWRCVATNAPALPFMSDCLYWKLFHQDPKVGLSPLGEAAIDAMADEHVLVDISHMSPAAIAQTFRRHDQMGGGIPVIASHTACRFGRLEYAVDDLTIREVAERGGVLGLIACKHYLESGLAKPTTFSDSVDLLCRHIDHICEVTGSEDHVAIGSDIDGFIKPTVPGLEDVGKMRALEAALEQKYGHRLARKVCSDNALGLLTRYWRGGP
jgi:microsomal dipeptidase-like Zn-dependent dipeptidase